MNTTQYAAPPQRRADIPVRHARPKAGWKTRPPLIKPKALETDAALKEILGKLGV